MIRFFLMALLSVNVWAAYPKVYATLGDPIYSSMPQFETLSEIQSMKKYKQGIGDFLRACKAAKEEGTVLDKGYSVASDRRAYLDKLRLLDTQQRFFMEAAQKVLEETMASENYADFARLIETGLIDAAGKRREITAFYEKYRGTERIEKLDAYLAEDQAARERAMSEQEKRRARYERYKKQRIEQINRRQKAAKAAKRREIDKEAERQKQEAYRMQEEELRLNR